MNRPTDFTAEIRTGGKTYIVVDNYSCEVFSARLKKSKERITLEIEPFNEMMFDSICIRSTLVTDYEDKLFFNGYQSWTDSREFDSDDKMRGLNGIPRSQVRKYNFDKYGDYNFVKYPNLPGELHGFSYCYVRKDREYLLIGSLSERNGFTVISYSSAQEELILRLDCEGAAYGERFKALDIVMLEGDEDTVFDRYFEIMNVRKPDVLPLSGYTSWYRHYQDIAEYSLLHDLKALDESGTGADIFQIDDGWQTAVGDWLSTDLRKFPDGIAPIADEIHSRDMLAGLWLAPFVCERDSDIFRTKSEWLLKDKYGEPVSAGCNWSGAFVLNFYDPDVREYLKRVFKTVLDEWDFDLVKLDFLYAVCEIPQNGRSRGQIMCEAMDFLRECMGDKLLLACGVPLAPAFGKADYCRIGCDVGLDWNDSRLMQMTHRERVSTKNSILNTIFRRQLDGRAFLNDPDVYLLRDDDLKLLHCQKQSLAIINHLCGSVYFTSDDVSGYSPKAKKVLSTACKMKRARVVSAEMIGSSVEMTIRLGEKQKTFRLLKDGRLSD